MLVEMSKVMKPSRSTRFVAAVIAVISLLFTQLALASYVCPDETTPERMTMAAADDGMAGMDHCRSMEKVDKAQPSLCHAHNHSDPQSLNKPDFPSVPPFHVIGPVLSVVFVDAGLAPPGVVTAMPSLSHATGPTLAIRHCCFRI
jgi:hypothetical protein